MPVSPVEVTATDPFNSRVRARTTSLDAWQRAVAESFVPLAVSSRAPRDFRADLHGCVGDRVLLSTVVASAHAVERSAEHIESSPEPYVMLRLQVRGTGTLVQDGREASLRPGDIFFYDTARPYALELSDELAAVIVMFPHRMLDVAPEALKALTAVRMAGDHGFAGAVGQYLTGLGSAIATLDRRTGLRVAHNTMDLISTLVHHSLGEVGYGDTHALLCHRIDTYLNAHLADPTLSPEKVAAANYISTRYLHAIFQRRGTTVSRWVRERRLEHARRDLLSPGSAPRSVAQIAAAWGFSDASHFAKMFREKFGTTPAQYRHGMLAGTGSVTHDVGEPDR